MLFHPVFGLLGCWVGVRCPSCVVHVLVHSPQATRGCNSAIQQFFHSCQKFAFHSILSAWLRRHTPIRGSWESLTPVFQLPSIAGFVPHHYRSADSEGELFGVHRLRDYQLKWKIDFVERYRCRSERNFPLKSANFYFRWKGCSTTLQGHSVARRTRQKFQPFGACVKKHVCLIRISI